MIAIIAVLTFLGLCLLSIPLGADSRRVETDGRGRSDWPGTPRIN